ncbi:uncharacterized protein LOC117191786 [Drosophila miranda]|uniref:uncharacterized protein LOC117191786 n=1 Tax=Drosophila miranda TaxID=7229 RepID=UPI00143F2E7B|nr:uncharacterized protein LOC117191786 [Drosophila miranda]
MMPDRAFPEQFGHVGVNISGFPQRLQYILRSFATQSRNPCSNWPQFQQHSRGLFASSSTRFPAEWNFGAGRNVDFCSRPRKWYSTSRHSSLSCSTFRTRIA